MGFLKGYPKFQAFDNSGNPLVGGLLYTYIAGTSTKKTTYQDADESVPNTNPIVLDGNGECTIFLSSGKYKFVLNNPNATPPATPDDIRWTVDDIEPLEFSSFLLHKTADYSLITGDLDGRTTFGNKGASTEVVFQLPEGQDNYCVSFIVGETQNLVVRAATGEYFRFNDSLSNAGGNISSSTKGTAFTIKWSGDEWVIIYLSGSVSQDGSSTWTLVPSSSLERNRWLNSEAMIDQRMEGTTSVATSSFIVDRHSMTFANTVTLVLNAWRVAGIGGFRNAINVKVNTAETTFTNNQYVIPIRYLFRGYDVADLAGETVTISFCFRAKIAGVYSLAVAAGDAVYTYVSDFDYLVAETDQTIIKTLTIDAANAITDTTTGIGLRVFIAGVGGSNFQVSTTDTWDSGGGGCSAAAAANMWINTINNYVRVSGMQLRKSSSYIALERKSYNDYLLECLPYYQKSYNIGVKPGAVSSLGRIREPANRNNINSTKGATFQTPMIATPTVTIYAPATGTSGKVHNNGEVTVNGVSDIGHKGFSELDLTGGGGDITYSANYHYTAEAEL